MGCDCYTEGMEPKFSTPWDSFILTLPKFNIVNIEGVYISSDHGGVDTTIDDVLQLIKENPKITRKELSETIGVASSAIQKHINRLKAKGIIRREGGDFGGHWEIIK